jgi:hypothetical protein
MHTSGFTRPAAPGGCESGELGGVRRASGEGARDVNRSQARRKQAMSGDPASRPSSARSMQKQRAASAKSTTAHAVVENPLV